MSPSMSGDAALPVSVRPSSIEDESVPVPMSVPVPEQEREQEQEQGMEEEEVQANAQPIVQGHVQDQNLLPASAPSRVEVLLAPDNGLKPPAAGDAAKAGVPSNPTTPVPSIENYVASDQNDKKARGPVPVPTSASASKRPIGHSLLTQQLAEARGIAASVTGHSLDAPHPSPRLQHLPCDLSIGKRPEPDLNGQARDTRSQITANDPEAYDEHDGDVLTPRASPRAIAIAMATASAVSTFSLPPRAIESTLSRTFDTSAFGDVEPRIRSHTDLARPAGRGVSTESNDRERRLKEPVYATRTYSDTSMPPPALAAAATMTSNRGPSQTNGRLDPGLTAEPPSPARPRKPDHRASMGPEKVWSIGSEDLSNAQDGQVEKSIAEVLAGVEHNARSRKASHSLRFFKEGLPEEKLKRRDSRLAPKEKGSVTDDVLQTGNFRAEDPSRSLQPSPCLSGDVPGRLTRTKTFPLPSTDTQNDDAGSVDYFKIRSEHKAYADLQSPAKPDDVYVFRSSEDLDHNTSKKGAKESEAISDTAVEDVTGDDGELSGEEKISSAVFVPHKGLQDVPEHSDESASDSDVHVKPHQKADNGSSWLVKADEPEADEPGTPNGPEDSEANERAHHRREAEHSVIECEPSARVVSVQSTCNEQDLAPHTVHNPAELASPAFEDRALVQTMVPEQPPDAIELVPYRHQVGGHTTVWRFSKKAVCKQLNNRENEFYEQIERHHRDLLPFLPRYIGVLNVTFSKQSRRKSIIKKEESAAPDSQRTEQQVKDSPDTNGSVSEAVMQSKDDIVPEPNSQPRLISQSLQTDPQPIPTVTFLDNQHILPRSLLQPATQTYNYMDRFRSSSVSVPASHYESNGMTSPESRTRPSLEDRHANSWGTTVVNQKLRHEVFNDVFSKSPISVQRHKKAHQRTIARKTLDRLLRPSSSDASLMRPESAPSQSSQSSSSDAGQAAPLRAHQKTQSDLGLLNIPVTTAETEPKDVTGTSAPEPDILNQSMSPQRKKRRHSGSALRRRPNDVSDDSRGNLRYWEEPDEDYKGDHEAIAIPVQDTDSPKTPPTSGLNGTVEAQGTEGATALSSYPSTAPSMATSPTAEFTKIPRPVNPKEAQVQRDSRVSYFLLLEDLTAGMKKPCIMDLKMGTRQYGVEATAKKQKSQQRKCAQTTSRELGVRVCGLQVWDAASQEYVFRDKYYGRSLKAGHEFQDALTRFLYDGVDRSSILRHIPTVLLKLSKLEVIVQRLRGYRFYAASLLVTYDGDQSAQDSYDTAIEDSTTDFATDNEDNNYVRKRKNKREIDFKIADFANSVTPQDLAMDKSCPPRHPDEPDRGFLKGLRSLRRYFLRIQQATREELGLPSAQRNLGYDPQMDVSEDEESVSE